MRRYLLVPLLLAGCHPATAPSGGDMAANTAHPVSMNSPAPVEPIAPGRPGGLADNRTPVSEAPFAPDSAQGAADVVQHYYALIESGRYGEAYKLRAPGGPTAAEFAGSFARYSEYHAQIGAPGEIDAGAGQRFVTVPVQAYGRDKSGKEFHEAGTVTLHRTADIDGATAEQKRWHIRSIDLQPVSGAPH
jgi:hypothetical protein